MRTILTILTLTAFSTGIGFAADAKAGQVAYSTSCKSCHGADGTPNPAMAKALKVEIKDLKSPEVQSLSDADLKKVITDGQGKMHPISSVTPAAADNIVAYIRTLKK
jgi:mono/diheme cytochrome c family protein